MVSESGGMGLVFCGCSSLQPFQKQKTRFKKWKKREREREKGRSHCFYSVSVFASTMLVHLTCHLLACSVTAASNYSMLLVPPVHPVHPNWGPYCMVDISAGFWAFSHYSPGSQQPQGEALVPGSCHSAFHMDPGSHWSLGLRIVLFW